MYTTIGFFKGDVQEKHQNLQTYKLSDGYAVEEKGLIMFSLEETSRLQRTRFDREPALIKIQIMSFTKTEAILTRGNI